MDFIKQFQKNKETGIHLTFFVNKDETDSNIAIGINTPTNDKRIEEIKFKQNEPDINIELSIIKINYKAV